MNPKETLRKELAVEVRIQDQRKDVVYDTRPSKAINNDGAFYELFYNDNDELVYVHEYHAYIKKSVYHYSSKGNLSSLIQYQHGDRKSIIKNFYDYSTSVKVLKEKRFYKSTHDMVKKEIYHQGKLNRIYYYKEGLVYYLEEFDKSGSLTSSSYFHENGLKVK